MKLVVKNTFRDKTDHVTVYESGTILEVKDKERGVDLVKRGLCSEYKGKKATTVTLGDETPDAPAEDVSETPAETPAEGEKPNSEKQ